MVMVGRGGESSALMSPATTGHGVGMGKLNQTTRIVATPGHLLVFTWTHKVCAVWESLGTRASINWPVVRPNKGP